MDKLVYAAKPYGPVDEESGPKTNGSMQLVRSSKLSKEDAHLPMAGQRQIHTSGPGDPLGFLGGVLAAGWLVVTWEARVLAHPKYFMQANCVRMFVASADPTFHRRRFFVFPNFLTAES